jgi:hypothetical protein
MRCGRRWIGNCPDGGSTNPKREARNNFRIPRTKNVKQHDAIATFCLGLEICFVLRISYFVLHPLSPFRILLGHARGEGLR